MATNIKVDARTPTDFSALFGEDVETRTSLRGNEVEQYPNLIEAVKRAYDEKRAVLMPARKAEPIPVADARKLGRLLGQAADHLGVGVSVTLVKDEADGKWSRIRETKDEPYKGTHARVRFQPGERRHFDPDKPRKPTWSPNMSAETFNEKWAAYTKSVREWNSSHDVKVQIADKPTEPSKTARGRKAAK